jgi:hypothetical protein
MVQIFGHLRGSDAGTRNLLDGIAKGTPPKPGPQIDRQLSAPVGGPTTLKSVKA